ncbi:MAG: hypothetical protein INR71_03405 [Terriglobus roseus]|nr:hypothetical protein [Terriglobus roseus]
MAVVAPVDKPLLEVPLFWPASLGREAAPEEDDDEVDDDDELEAGFVVLLVTVTKTTSLLLGPTETVDDEMKEVEKIVDGGTEDAVDVLVNALDVGVVEVAVLEDVLEEVGGTKVEEVEESDGTVAGFENVLELNVLDAGSTAPA